MPIVGATLDADAVARLQRLHLRVRDRLGDVGLARLDVEDPHVVVGQVPHHHLVEVRLASAPVVRVASQPQLLAGVECADGEGAGPDRRLRESARAELLICLLADDRGAEERQVEQQRRVGAAESDDDRAVALRSHRSDRRDERAERIGGIAEAIEREDDVGRGEGRAVGESDAVAQLEDVGEAVLAASPRRRQRGLRVDLPRHQLDELVEDLHLREDRAVVGRPDRIEALRLDVAIDHERSAADRLAGRPRSLRSASVVAARPAAACRCDGDCDQTGDQAHASSHAHLSRSSVEIQ